MRGSFRFSGWEMLGQYENYMSMANPPKIAVQACVCVDCLCVSASSQLPSKVQY